MVSEATKRREKSRDKTKKDLPFILYNMSIEDVQERSLKALPFSNGYEAAEFLDKQLKYVCHVADKIGKYVHSPDGNKWAVRTKKIQHNALPNQ
jgi:hypothetical protein